ncbi:MAG: DUF368 domain-containing protein [Chitinispirillales bacterium]|jgi:putative membrane protein|nr:DUF368 domain-containing protein [Chitinispirillales bacterium]
MLKWLKQAGSGFLVGAANIIPGISGGTLLFLLGLYERSMTAISNIKPNSIKTILRYALGSVLGNQRKENRKNFIEQIHALDIPFLISLVSGAGLAILLLSGVMKFLLEQHFTNTYAFFFGLIAISAAMSSRMLKVKKPIHIIHVIVGIALTVALTASVDPAVNTQAKIERDRDRIASQTGVSSDESSGVRLKYTGRYSGKELAAGAVSGAIAICAMILPGLSGSLVFILMGQYHEVISAVSGLKTLQLDYFVFLTIMSIGMGLGILIFARAINFIYKRFYDDTIALMIGLVIGSLYALWPFKRILIMDQYVKNGGGITLIESTTIQTNINILPSDIATMLPALLFCGLGIGIMIALDRLALKRKA